MNFYSGIKDQNKVALTFDDGPNPTVTPLILDILKDKDVKATFFLLGKRVAQFPVVAKRIVDEGHCIGNHTFNHTNDFDKCQDTIHGLLGVKCKLFKPPSNALANCVDSSVVKEPDSKVINFCPMPRPCAESCPLRNDKQYHIDTSDWQFKIQQQCPHAKKTGILGTLATVSSGNIIQLHDGNDHDREEDPLWNLRAIPTLFALPDIIDKIRGKGLQLVSLGEVTKFHEHTCSEVTLGS